MNEQQKRTLQRALPVLKSEGVLSGSTKYINPIRKPEKAKPKEKGKTNKKGFWNSLFN